MARKIRESLLTATLLLPLLSTVPLYAKDSWPIARSVDSSLLAQAPDILTFYLYRTKEAQEPVLIQPLDHGQWQADVDLHHWPLARGSTIHFQALLTGLTSFDTTLWVEMDVDGVPVGERSALPLAAAGAGGISVEGLVESRSLTLGGFKFPDGSIQTTAASNAGSGGTITSITAGAGLVGGTITSSGTLSVATGGIVDSMISGPVDAGKIDAAITRDSELTAGLAGKADAAHDHAGNYYSKSEVDALIDAQKIANIISVAKDNGDFNDPIAALASITDASESNPYLVKIAPGVYELGSHSLTLKPYIFVQGSGKDITIISSSPAISEGATVIVAENSSISDLTVRSTANVSGYTIGMVGDGENFLIRSCKIEATNSAFVAVGFATNSTLYGPPSGTLDNVEIIVDGTGRGIGDPYSHGEGTFLIVKNSRIRVLANGTGVGGADLDGNFTSDGSFLLVTDTLIELHGSGTAVTNTDGARQLYRNILIRSESDNVAAFAGAGSNFRPRVENSRIDLSGAGTVGFRTNNGVPRIRNSYVRASTGFSASSPAWTPTFYIDHSTIEGTNAIRQDNTGGNVRIKFGATQLKVTNNLQAINGTIDATCVNSYDENYASIDSTCN